MHSFSGTSSVEPPIERANYIAAKERLDPSNQTDLDELKKLLMRRAIRAIPILLSLQNEGTSIERLYKRGMLTDDMHFKVKDLKAFVDQEFQDVQFEADDLVEGWSQHIWPQAMQFHTVIDVFVACIFHKCGLYSTLGMIMRVREILPKVHSSS